VQTTTYDAFGNVESSTGSSSNVYRYAGQHGYRNDGDDGLMHVGARYYDPLVGRFLQADTYLGQVGNPQSLNRYAYVENNPVNAVDPSGKVPWLLIVAIVVLIVSTPEHPDHPGSIMIDPEPGMFYGSLLSEIGAWCFVAGTLIHTREGLKPIEEIQAGEWILSKDEQTGEVSYQRVARTFKHTTPQIVTVQAGKETIQTTPEHPFYVEGKGWVRAGSLEVGDKLLTSDNGTLAIEVVKVGAVRGPPVVVYNLEVAGTHTYFVGKRGVWVHNKPAWGPRKPGKFIQDDFDAVDDIIKASKGKPGGKYNPGKSVQRAKHKLKQIRTKEDVKDLWE